MTAENQGWTADNGPDTTGCEIGQHDWGDAEECDLCADDRCLVTCRDCETEDRACEDS